MSEHSPRVGVPTAIRPAPADAAAARARPLPAIPFNRLRPGGREDHASRAGNSLFDFSGPGSSLLDLAFSSFPRMKWTAVGVGYLNPMHGRIGRALAASGSSGAPCAGSKVLFILLLGALCAVHARLHRVFVGAPFESQIAHSSINRCSRALKFEVGRHVDPPYVQRALLERHARIYR